MKTLLVLSLLVTCPLHAAETSAAKKTSEVSAMAIVGGQVRRPGPVNFRKGLTLYAAVQEAGGATEFGSMRRVKVMRDGKSTVHNLTKDEAKMLAVEAGDTIEVPQKTIFGR